MMTFRHLVVASLAAALAFTMTPAGADQATRRVDLPGAAGVRFPYTVEIPANWEVQEIQGAAVVYLGPKGATPPRGDETGVYVRISPKALTNPDETAASIRKAAAETKDWRAALVEVRDVAGVRGVLVQMESGEGPAARTTLVLKMPLPKTSVDFMAAAPAAEFAKLRPAFEHVLFSVRPVH